METRREDCEGEMREAGVMVEEGEGWAGLWAGLCVGEGEGDGEGVGGDLRAASTIDLRIMCEVAAETSCHVISHHIILTDTH